MINKNWRYEKKVEKSFDSKILLNINGARVFAIDSRSTRSGGFFSREKPGMCAANARDH